MHTSNWAYIVLISLNLVRWLCISALIFAFIQLVRGKLKFLSVSFWLWVLIPAIAITTSNGIEAHQKETLLKDRLSQTWTWSSNDTLHSLTINTVKQTYLHSAEPLKTAIQDAQRQKPAAIAGNTSPFNKQVDAESQEIYYSVYLFDFPQGGQTTMISISGLSSPKIHLGENKILALR
jgi:hypothetical protein